MRKVCVDLVFYCAKIRKNEIVAVQKVQNVIIEPRLTQSKLNHLP